MSDYKPRTRAICKTCGKNLARGWVIRHNWKEHPEVVEALRDEMKKYGGWGLHGPRLWQLADPLPGEIM